MNEAQFFYKMMKEEYPHAGRLRHWWERKKFEFWLDLPSGNGKETNRDFIKQIPPTT